MKQIVWWTFTDDKDNPGVFMSQGGGGMTFHALPEQRTREAIAQRLEEMRPASLYTHKYVEPEEMERIRADIRCGEHSLDAAPLAQIADLVRDATEGTQTSRYAAQVGQIARQYEVGGINQSTLLNALKELSMKVNKEISKKDYSAQTRQSWHMLFFFCEIIALQIPDDADRQGFHSL